MLRVAIVDDSPDLCVLLRMTIDDDGWGEVVGEAHDGYSGIQLIRRTRPDIAIVDLHMPGMGGIELIQYVRTMTDLQVRIIAYSADDAALGEAIRVGADAVVVKSSGSSDLLRALSTVCEQPGG